MSAITPLPSGGTVRIAQPYVRHSIAPIPLPSGGTVRITAIGSGGWSVRSLAVGAGSGWH